MSFAEQLPFWNKLNYHERNYIERSIFIKHYSRGEPIFDSCDSYIGITQILTGRARMYISADDGKELTLFRIRKGECLVLSAADIMERITYETRLVAEDDTDVLMLGKAEFDSLVNNSIEVKAFAYQSIAEHLSDVMCGLKRMILEKLDQRIASFLIQESNSGEHVIYITQEQIASEFGTAREVVTRILGHFEASGYIALKRGQIAIVNPQELKLRFNL